jgi:DNA polymerase-4
VNRAIVHLNVADFAVAVERRLSPSLKRRPVIVAPEGGARTVVYDMSQEAYLAGVRKGMALSMAVRRCSDAHVLPPRAERYEQAMAAMLKKALAFSPLIERGRDDGHLFVDATGTHRLFGSPADVAFRLRRQIKADLGLDPIWAVASNKLVAKVATRLVKPAGEYIVSGNAEASFLSPLPVSLIPGIERDDLVRLAEFNLTRACHVTKLGLAHLETAFGTRGRFIYEAVRGIDTSPVLPAGQHPPRVSLGHPFGQDTNDPSVVAAAVYRLVEQAGRRLRQQRLAARRIAVFMDHSDGVRRIRQASVSPASANDLTLFKTAQRALALAWTRRIRLRHIRLMCDRLVFPPAQAALFPEDRRETQKCDDLVSAMDGIRSRFGPDAIRTGRTLAA